MTETKTNIFPQQLEGLGWGFANKASGSFGAAAGNLAARRFPRVPPKEVPGFTEVPDKVSGPRSFAHKGPTAKRFQIPQRFHL